MGNWYINIESPGEALEHHARALGIAEELNDAPLLAETYDYLGMAMIIVGDTRRSADYYSRAIKLFHETDNPFGVVSSQSAFGFLHRNYDTDLVIVHESYKDTIPQMEEALGLEVGEHVLGDQELGELGRLGAGVLGQEFADDLIELSAVDPVAAAQIPDEPFTGSKFSRHHDSSILCFRWFLWEERRSLGKAARSHGPDGCRGATRDVAPLRRVQPVP